MKKEYTYMLLIYAILILFISSFPNINSASPTPVATVEIVDEFGGSKTIYVTDGSGTFEIKSGVKHWIRISSFGYRSTTLEVPPLTPTENRFYDVTLSTAPLIEGYIRNPFDDGVEGATIQIGDDKVFSSRNGYYAIYVDADVGDTISYLIGPPYNPETFRSPPYYQPGTNVKSTLFINNDDYLWGYSYGNLTINSKRMLSYFNLQPSTQINGQLLYDDNSPVESGRILIVGKNNPIVLSTNVQNGLFSIDGRISPDSYYIYYVGETETGRTKVLLDEDFTLICPGLCPSQINIGYIMPRLSSAILTILNDDGEPLPNISILIKSTDGIVNAYGTSDSSGVISLPLFFGSEYNYSILIGGYVAESDSFIIPSFTPPPYTKEFRLPIKLYNVAGRVVNIDAGVEPIRIKIVGETSSDGPYIKVEELVRPNPDGTFNVKVMQYLMVGGFNTTLNYSIYLDSDYLYAGEKVVELGMISSDTSGLSISIPDIETSTITLNINFNGIPEQPTNRMEYNLSFWIGNNIYTIKISNGNFSGICVGYCGVLSFEAGSLQKNGDSGNLSITIKTVSAYQSKIFLLIPKEVADRPFTFYLVDGLSVNDVNRQVSGITGNVYYEAAEYFEIVVDYMVDSTSKHTITVNSTRVISELNPLILVIISIVIALVLRKRIR